MEKRDARGMRCEFEQDGGAYVLGALSPDERVAYERHLVTCPICRQTMAEFSILPDLLGRLDPARFPSVPPGSRSAFSAASAPSAGSPSPAGLSSARSAGSAFSAASAYSAASLRSLLAWLRQPRGLVLIVASMVLVAGGSVGAVLMVGRASVLPPATTAPSSSRPVAMRLLDDDVPMSAQLTLVPSAPSSGSGTRIDLVCFYGHSAEYPRAYPIRLMAFGSDGTADQVGTWVAVAGQKFVMSGLTRFPLDQLFRLELVGSDGTELLAYDVP